jgi:hypothetical protein
MRPLEVKQKKKKKKTFGNPIACREGGTVVAAQAGDL